MSVYRSTISCTFTLNVLCFSSSYIYTHTCSNVNNSYVYERDVRFKIKLKKSFIKITTTYNTCLHSLLKVGVKTHARNLCSAIQRCTVLNDNNSVHAPTPKNIKHHFVFVVYKEKNTIWCAKVVLALSRPPQSRKCYDQHAKCTKRRDVISFFLYI